MGTRTSMLLYSAFPADSMSRSFSVPVVANCCLMSTIYVDFSTGLVTSCDIHYLTHIISVVVS